MFGIAPWEQRERLSGEELLAACEYIDDVNERARKAGG